MRRPDSSLGLPSWPYLQDVRSTYKAEVHAGVQDGGRSSRDRYGQNGGRSSRRAVGARQRVGPMGARRASSARRGGRVIDEPLSAAERTELCGCAARWPSRTRTWPSWEKLPRTSLRIHQSREICVDGRRVRELRDHPHGPPVGGVFGRLLPLEEGSGPATAAERGSPGRSRRQDHQLPQEFERHLRRSPDHPRPARGRGAGQPQHRGRPHGQPRHRRRQPTIVQGHHQPRSRRHLPGRPGEPPVPPRSDRRAVDLGYHLPHRWRRRGLPLRNPRRRVVSGAGVLGG